MEIDSLDYDSVGQNSFYCLGEQPAAIQKQISDGFASSSLSAAPDKNEMLPACQKANPHFSVQPHAIALQGAALEEKKLAVIAKVDMQRRPMPVLSEDPWSGWDDYGDFVVDYTLWYHGPECYSVFVTLENGTRYFMPELWEVHIKDTRHIPSFLTEGKTVEIVSLPRDPTYRNYPRIAFRDIETGQTSAFFIKW